MSKASGHISILSALLLSIFALIAGIAIGYAFSPSFPSSPLLFFRPSSEVLSVNSACPSSLVFPSSSSSSFSSSSLSPSPSNSSSPSPSPSASSTPPPPPPPLCCAHLESGLWSSSLHQFITLDRRCQLPQLWPFMLDSVAVYRKIMMNVNVRNDEVKEDAVLSKMRRDNEAYDVVKEADYTKDVDDDDDDEEEEAEEEDEDEEKRAPVDIHSMHRLRRLMRGPQSWSFLRHRTVLFIGDSYEREVVKHVCNELSDAGAQVDEYHKSHREWPKHTDAQKEGYWGWKWCYVHSFDFLIFQMFNYHVNYSTPFVDHWLELQKLVIDAVPESRRIVHNRRPALIVIQTLLWDLQHAHMFSYEKGGCKEEDECAPFNVRREWADVVLETMVQTIQHTYESDDDDAEEKDDADDEKPMLVWRTAPLTRSYDHSYTNYMNAHARRFAAAHSMHRLDFASMMNGELSRVYDYTHYDKHSFIQYFNVVLYMLYQRQYNRREFELCKIK